MGISSFSRAMFTDWLSFTSSTFLVNTDFISQHIPVYFCLSFGWHSTSNAEKAASWIFFTPVLYFSFVHLLICLWVDWAKSNLSIVATWGFIEIEKWKKNKIRTQMYYKRKGKQRGKAEELKYKKWCSLFLLLPGNSPGEKVGRGFFTKILKLGKASVWPWCQYPNPTVVYCSIIRIPFLLHHCSLCNSSTIKSQEH